MKNIIIVILPFLLGNCVHPKLNKNTLFEKKLTAIDFHSTITLFDTSGKSYDILDDHESIYCYQDLIMYQLPVETYLFQEAKTQQDSILPVTYRYLVFEEKGDTIAFSYRSATDPIKDTASVNAFLSNGFRNFGESYKKSTKSAVLFNRQKTKNEIIETYTNRNKLNDSFSDTTFYYYRKDYNDIRYSLASEPDSIAKKKLYKVVAVNNGTPHATDIFYRQPRKLKLEISRKKINDPEMIISIFDRFRKDLIAYRSRVPRR